MINNECFVKYISEMLGVLVCIFMFVDYDGVIQGLLGGMLDVVIFGVLGYVKVYLMNFDVVELVLVKINFDGLFEYFLVGFVCKDYYIILLVDMKGKVLGFGDLNLILGYLIFVVEMFKQGYLMELGVYFKDIKFIGGYEQIIVVVNNGDVDVGVIWVDGLGNWEDGYNLGVLCKVVDVGLVDMNDMVEIWCLELILEGLLVVCKVLFEDVKVKFIVMMVDLINIDKDCIYGVVGGEIVGFILVKYDNYLLIIEVCKLEEVKGS